MGRPCLLALHLAAVAGATLPPSRTKSTGPRVPHWTMAAVDRPNVSLPAAGLRPLLGATHATIFNPERKRCCWAPVSSPCPRSPACLGTYNHGPLITLIGGSLLLVSWHNCEYDEDAPGGRVLASHSVDGHSWAEPLVLFDSLPSGTSAPLKHSVPRNIIRAHEATTPFCALDTASSHYYIKVGGEASVRCGWDGGKKYDKCCRRLAADCRWFKNLSSCEAKLQLATSDEDFCFRCDNNSNIGCPAVFTPGPPPAPPVPNIPMNGTNLYASGFVSFGSDPVRQYAVASGYVGLLSARCRMSEQHACPLSASAGCCSKGLGCCKCMERRHLPSLMRRVSVNVGGNLTLGAPFWTTASLPSWTPRASLYASLRDMDAEAQADAAAFVAQLLQQRPPDPPKPVVLSERSVFFQKSEGSQNDGQMTAKLAMLIRDDGTPSSLRMWASLCNMQNITKAAHQRMEKALANGENLLSTTQCNWSAVLETNIPDSRSKTCAGSLGRDGLRYLLGNQLPQLWDRDPLTISLSPDGISFNCVYAVRANAGPQYFPGWGKGEGYQYPAAAVVDDALVIVYSINKEGIGVTRVPMQHLVCVPHTGQTAKFDDVVSGKAQHVGPSPCDGSSPGSTT